MPVLVTQSQSQAAPVDAASGRSLPVSTSNTITFMEHKNKRRANGQRVVAARSINGGAWEVVPDLDFPPVNLTCVGSVCDVPNPLDFVFRTVAVPSRIAAPTQDGRTARFLMQATFGPTLSAIYAGVADTTAWIRDQMALAPTLHRAYWRMRSNPPGPYDRQNGGVRAMCASGSRWSNYALNWFDEKRIFAATASGTRFVMRVEGRLRGYIAALPAGYTAGTNATICTVDPRVNGTVALSVDGCATIAARLVNPVIDLGTTPPTTTQVLAVADATFASVRGRSDAFILTSILVPCTVSGNVVFLRHNGRDLLHDPRLSVVRNTNTQPALVGQVNTTLCSSVTPNFLNAATCVRGPSCVAPAFTAANVRLDDASLRSWYTTNTSRRYVYYGELFFSLSLSRSRHHTQNSSSSSL